MNQIITPDQAVIALFVPLVIQLLKKANVWGLNWIHQNTPLICAGVSALAALITTVGIHFMWDPAAHSLLITGLDPTAVISNLILSVQMQFALQHVSYEGFWRSLVPVAAPAPKGA